MRIALVVAILLLLCGCEVFSESQPPPPGKAIRSDQKQENSRHINYTSKVLINNPTPHNIESIKTTNPEAQINKCQKNNDSPSEWWMIGLTAILAFVTYRLFVETRKLVTETATVGDYRNTGFCWEYCHGDETTGFAIADSDLNYCDTNNDNV